MGYALKPRTPKSAASGGHEKEMSSLVSALISLAHSQPSSAEAKVDDIALASRSSLNRALGVMLASDFINAVLLMVQSADPMVSTRVTEVSVSSW